MSRKSRKLADRGLKYRGRARQLRFERLDSRRLLATDFAWAVGGAASGGSDVDVGPDGNLYTTGATFAAKHTPSGTLVWATSGGPAGSGIKVGADGSIYICGSYSGTVDFDPGAAAYPLTSAGSSDIFVAKLTSSGGFLWARSMGGTGADVCKDLAIDSAGDIALTGKFQVTADFDPGPGVQPLTSTTDDDIYVCTLDTNGNLTWARSMVGVNQSRNSEFGDSIAIDGAGNVLVTGSFNSTVDFDPGANEKLLVSTLGSTDAFVLKLDQLGNLVWACQLGSSVVEQVALGRGIANDALGNVYVAGFAAGRLDFDPGPGIYYGAGIPEGGFIWRLDSDGVLGWAQLFRASMSNGGDLEIGPEGHLYVAGATASSRFFAQFDNAGNLIRLRDGAGGQSVAVDSQGNSYAVGTYSGTVDFDPSAGVYNLTAAAPNEAYLLRLNDFELNAALGGRAWSDANGNGLQDFGEPGLAGVALELFRSTDSVVGNSDDRTVRMLASGADGQFLFDELDWTYNYFIVARAPAGFSATATPGVWTITTANQGGDDTVDSDIDTATGRTAMFVVAENQSVVTCGAGFRGSSPVFGWGTDVDSTNQSDGRFVVRNADGNVYVAGSYLTNADFDLGPGTIGGASAKSFFLNKYTAAGALLWSGRIQLGSANNPYERITGLEVDSAGAVYLQARLGSPPTFVLPAATFNLGSITGGFSGDHLIKFTSHGGFSWARFLFPSSSTYDTTSAYSDSLAIDPAGNVFVIREILYNSTSGISKFDQNGSLVWEIQTDIKRFAAAAADEQGNLYITGYFSGTLDFDPGPGVFNMSGGLDGFILKLDGAGNFQWVRRIATGNGTLYNVPYGIHADWAGHIIITGPVDAAATLDSGSGGPMPVIASAAGAYVAKLDLQGNLVWSKGIAGAMGSRSVAVDAAGSIYSTGEFLGTVDFDPSAGIFNLSSDGFNDVFVWKIDSFGRFVWAARGGPGVEQGLGVAADDDQGVFITGQFQGTSDFDPTAGNFSLTAPGGEMFLAYWKTPAPLRPGDFDSDGDVDGADFVAWQTNFPKPSGATLAQGDADGDGDVDGADFVVWQTNFPFIPSAGAIAPVTGSGFASSAPGAEANSASVSPSAAQSAVGAHGNNAKSAVAKVTSPRVALGNVQGAVPASNTTNSPTQPTAHFGSLVNLPRVMAPPNVRAPKAIESVASDSNALPKRSALSAAAVDYWLQVSTMYHTRHGRRSVAAAVLE